MATATQKPPAARQAPEGTLLLTDREVATELRMGLTKTRRLIREGRIPSIRIDGHRRVRREDLTAYVDGLTETATS
jgi:excisionase family DNA binding protein